MAQAQAMAGEPSAQIVVSVQRPENLSRLHLLLKTFFGFIYVGIPHGIILWALSIAAWAVSLAAFVVILFTGRYPKSLFDFAVAYQRWNLRVIAYAGPFIGNFMVDKYPPFSFEEEPDDPVILRVEYPETLSRPHGRTQATVGLALRWHTPRDHPPLLRNRFVDCPVRCVVHNPVHRQVPRVDIPVRRGVYALGDAGEPLPRLRHGQIPQVQSKPLAPHQEIDSKEKRRRTAPTLFLPE